MVGGVEHQQHGPLVPGRGEVQYPPDQVGGGQTVGLRQIAAGIFCLDGEVPQVPGALHQGTPHHCAAGLAGGQHQLPAYGLCVQVSGAVHQHTAHGAIKTAGMGA